MDKQTIREKYLKIRNNLSDKESKSNIIFEQIINTQEYQRAQVIALYKNLKSEVSTDKLINYSLTIGKIVVLPRTENNHLIFYKITNNSHLIKSSFGIFEPIKNDNDLVNPKDIDLMIIPGVCFDKNKNRLGFGKGYYDRCLIDLKITKIGICFHEQLISNLPTSPNDIKMDLIITDKEIL